ncbi:MAG TPA: ABC transporter ATP-binding protein, partial [Geminicoccaceae bacterium]
AAADARDAGRCAPVLVAQDLTVRFQTADGEVLAADRLSFEIGRGESAGVVGESGSGKTQTFLALMGLLARNGRATGSVRFRDEEILNLPPKALNRVRGVRLSMIFQDPMSALNPYLRISRQMTEVLTTHKGLGREAARERAIALLDRVGIPAVRRRFDLYPHEFSGGMRQRVMIAMALLCEPELLIADEPTTALDVTVQAQILDLLGELQRDFGMAIVLITHDLAVVAGLCERVLVMYAGRIVEEAPVDALFEAPQHPYSAGLLRSMPRIDEARREELTIIPGQPPDLQAMMPGCAFTDRCRYAFERCPADRPALRPAGPGRRKACHLEALPREPGPAGGRGR